MSGARKQENNNSVLADDTFESGQNMNVGGTGFDSETISLPAAAGFGDALLVLLLLALYVGLQRAHPVKIREEVIDPDKLAKHGSTKDESVAMPIITERQAKTMWDKPGAPKDEVKNG